MKYIHIVQFHLRSGGGVGSVISDLCQEMAKQSREIYVISLFKRDGIDFKDELEWGRHTGVKVLLMQGDNDSKTKALFRLRKTLYNYSKSDICCLYLHLKWGTLAGILSSFGIRNIRRVEVYHSGYKNYKLQAFLSRPFIEHYISVSLDAKQQLKEWFHIPENKISVIYNGVDIQTIRQKAHAHSAKPYSFLFMSVGRLSYEKNFLLSISAYVNLIQEGILCETSYIMVGDGPQREEAERISNGRVKFTGLVHRDSVYPLLSLADVVVLPSLWEGNSILLLETMAVGKPVLVSDIPSFRENLNFEPLRDEELFRIERFGAVFRNDSEDSCQAAMTALCNNRDELATQAEYIRSLSNDYSISKQAASFFEVFSKNY